MTTPLYSSLADSFRLHFYLPKCGITTPPVVTYTADEHLQQVMESAAPPQSVFIYVTPDLSKLHAQMQLIHKKAIPILFVNDENLIQPLVEYADFHHLGDVTFCVPYHSRHRLKTLRKALPLSRGMLDLRQCGLPDNPADISADCQMNEATMILVEDPLPRSTILSLQKRFIQVWTQTDGTQEHETLSLLNAILSGTCGILTSHPAALYHILEQFPEDSVVRPTLLYAHKCLHATDEFPENSIPGGLAAGKRGYDACEIDICFTKDDVLILQHDQHSGNLFTEKKVIRDTAWEELQTLRRIKHPEHGFDRFDDFMGEMAAYPETPVLIEIKTPAHTFGVEAAVRQMSEILASPRSQKNCTCIMGAMPPYLSYVHEHLPALPLAHCAWNREDTPTDDMDTNNLRVYAFAEETKGANAGYNPYHVQCGADFVRMMHLRGITIFTWTWAFKPWEEECGPISDCYMAGYDGITSDWVFHYENLPVDLDPENSAMLLRNGKSLPCDMEILTIDNVCLYYCDCTLPNGKVYHFFE